MTTIARGTVILFGLFIICVGFLMLFAPQEARKTLKAAASTNFINYAEIILRMVPATGLIVYAGSSRYPVALQLFGWTMLATSVVLLFIPRRLHHAYALQCAEVLQPAYIRLLAPIAFLLGSAIVYCAL